MLDVLLSRPFDGRDELSAQASAVTATDLSCKCGCPSIDLAVDRAVPSAPVRGMVAEGVGLDRNGNRVGVLLFVDDDGYLNGLEVYGFGDDIHGRTADTFGRPTVESFELAEWESWPNGMGANLKNVLGRATPDKN